MFKKEISQLLQIPSISPGGEQHLDSRVLAALAATRNFSTEALRLLLRGFCGVKPVQGEGERRLCARGRIAICRRFTQSDERRGGPALGRLLCQVIEGARIKPRAR